MRNIFDTLGNAKSFASRANAERHLNKFSFAIPEEASVFVAPRPQDGRWIAVVIHRNDLILNIPFLCGNGICVVN